MNSMLKKTDAFLSSVVSSSDDDDNVIGILFDVVNNCIPRDNNVLSALGTFVGYKDYKNFHSINGRVYLFIHKQEKRPIKLVVDIFRRSEYNVSCSWSAADVEFILECSNFDLWIVGYRNNVFTFALYCQGNTFFFTCGIWS
jgi:hypothetical protein